MEEGNSIKKKQQNQKDKQRKKLYIYMSIYKNNCNKFKCTDQLNRDYYRCYFKDPIICCFQGKHLKFKGTGKLKEKMYPADAKQEKAGW